MVNFVNEESIEHLYKNVQNETSSKNYLKQFEIIFKNNLFITEKIDGMSFSAKYLYDEDKFKFYKRNKNKQITYFDRLLMRQYDFFIDYFENHKEFIRNWFETNFKISENGINEIRIDVEILIDNDLALIKYDKPIKNNMVLTGVWLDDVIITDKKGVDKLLNFSEEFDIEPLQIIFIGKLPETKIEKLSKSCLKLIEDRDNFDFVNEIIKVLSPKRVVKPNENFEGVVIHVEGYDNPFKIVDVKFEDYKKIQNDMMPDFETEYPKALELVSKYFNYVVNNKELINDYKKDIKELPTKDKKSVYFNAVMYYYFAMAHEEEIKEIEKENGNDIFQLKNIDNVIPDDIYKYITATKKSEFLIRYILRLTKGSRIKAKEINNDKYVEILKKFL